MRVRQEGFFCFDLVSVSRYGWAISLLGLLHAGWLQAVEFPDIFELFGNGRRTPFLSPAPSEGSSTEKQRLSNPLELAVSKPPLSGAYSQLLPFFRAPVLRTPKALWVLSWIEADGHRSAPIPWWVDRQGNGHALLEAVLPIGEETLPERKPLCLKLSQILSVYLTRSGELYPVASQVWLSIPRKEGEPEVFASGVGAWKAHSPLFVRRVVYQPYRQAVERLVALAHDRLWPEACAELLHKQWPDVLLEERPLGNAPLEPKTPSREKVWALAPLTRPVTPVGDPP